jgi:hypothetical protein
MVLFSDVNKMDDMLFDYWGWKIDGLERYKILCLIH